MGPSGTISLAKWSMPGPETEPKAVNCVLYFTSYATILGLCVLQDPPLSPAGFQCHSPQNVATYLLFWF